MTGILAFFAAVLQTMPSPPPSPSSSSSGSSPDLSLIPDHLRPSALWTWQVRYLSPPLLSHPLTPALWATFLEVAGPRLADLYGRQTVKVWSLLLNKGLREKSAGFANDPNAKAASTRLALLLEEWEKMGRLQGTGGREMEA